MQDIIKKLLNIAYACWPFHGLANSILDKLNSATQLQFCMILSKNCEAFLFSGFGKSDRIATKNILDPKDLYWNDDIVQFADSLIVTSILFN